MKVLYCLRMLSGGRWYGDWNWVKELEAIIGKRDCLCIEKKIEDENWLTVSYCL